MIEAVMEAAPIVTEALMISSQCIWGPHMNMTNVKKIWVIWANIIKLGSEIAWISPTTAVGSDDNYEALFLLL